MCFFFFQRLLLLIWASKLCSAFLGNKNAAPVCRGSSLASFVDTSIEIDNLMDEPEFDRYDKIDKTLRGLCHQLPFVLAKPLTSDQDVYAPDIVLLGPTGEELASDCKELASLSATLVAATAAARQASLLASSFSRSPSTMDGGETQLVSCDLVLETESLHQMRVFWNTTIVTPLPGASPSCIQGVSELWFDPKTARISQHQVRTIEIDGQKLDAVGETLATLRRAVRSVQESPLIQTFNSIGVLSDIRDELIQQSQQRDEQEVHSCSIPNLYGIESFDDDDDDSAIVVSDMKHISPLAELSMKHPLPGTPLWAEYAAAHRTICNFVETTLGMLSSPASSRDSLSALFDSKCELKGIDGGVLSSGGDEVVEFYRLLASVRQGNLLGKWQVEKAKADWESRSVTVSWVSKNPVRVRGKDCFVLGRDGTIMEVQQVKLEVEGTRVTDPEWIQGFVSAVKTSGSTIGADLVLDLLQQVNSALSPPTPKSDASSGMLNDDAASRVYGILCALHADVASLEQPPANAYVDADIQLKGYLDEVLARGDGAYRQMMGFALATLRGVLGTNRIILDSPPQSRVEFLSDGTTIQLDLLLQLKLQDLGVPIRISILSEYKVGSDGMIVQHKLLETRVNGRLTPGDVITRFLKGGYVRSGSGTSIVEESAASIRALFDFVNWVRDIS